VSRWKRSDKGLVIAGLILALAPTAARAAHPLQTEATGTQGAGNVELENGLSGSRQAGSRSFAYQPQLSVGLAPSLDAIVQPSWLDNRSGGQRQRGLGDTHLDAKWRFLGEAPWSLAVRAGATLATAEQGLGQPHGRIGSHALLATTFDAAPFTAHANLGLTRNPAGSGLRREVTLVSAALMWAANERWLLTVDGQLAGSADPQRTGTTGAVLAGVICTLWPGLDADIGYQVAGGAMPVQRQWLAGLTYRFAP